MHFVKAKGILSSGNGMNIFGQSLPGTFGSIPKKYGESYEVMSPENRRLTEIFHSVCRRCGIMSEASACFDCLRAFPKDDSQMSIF